MHARPRRRSPIPSLPPGDREREELVRHACPRGIVRRVGGGAVIVSLALILLAQLVGEAVARGAGVPVPGPVIGAALIVAFLAIRDRWRRLAERILPEPLTDGGVETVCKSLLAHLSLLFVPAGVGIVGRLDRLSADGLALAVVLVVSVIATLVATAVTFVFVSRRMRHDPEDGASAPSP